LNRKEKRNGMILIMTIFIEEVQKMRRSLILAGVVAGMFSLCLWGCKEEKVGKAIVCCFRQNHNFLQFKLAIWEIVS